MGGPRRRIEHRVIDGKPKGILTTVEHLEYGGLENGKRVYSSSEVDKWKAIAFLLGSVALVAVLKYLGWV